MTASAIDPHAGGTQAPVHDGAAISHDGATGQDLHSGRIRSPWLGFVCLYILALINAGIGRVVLTVLDAQGSVSYLYNTTGAGSMADQLSELITGLPLMVVLGAAAIIGALFACTHAVIGISFSRRLRVFGPGKAVQRACLPDFCALVLASAISLLVLVILVGGFVSPVQMQVIMSKAGSGSLGTTLIVLFLALCLTLLLAGQAVVYAAVSLGHSAARAPGAGSSQVILRPGRLVLALLLGTAVSGLVAGILGGFVFAEFNVVSVNADALTGKVLAALAGHVFLVLLFAAIACVRDKALDSTCSKALN